MFYGLFAFKSLLYLQSYGADKDRQFQIEGEDLNGVLSARNFVGWYNGLPQDSQVLAHLKCEDCF